MRVGMDPEYREAVRQLECLLNGYEADIEPDSRHGCIDIEVFLNGDFGAETPQNLEGLILEAADLVGGSYDGWPAVDPGNSSYTYRIDL